VISKQVTIINKLGLHARAAAKFVGCTSSFSSAVRAGVDGDMVDGKSIMSVMMLAAAKGTTLDLEVEGTDEEAAMAALEALINNRFDEGE
jgi:phosphocarrier protein